MVLRIQEIKYNWFEAKSMKGDGQIEADLENGERG